MSKNKEQGEDDDDDDDDDAVVKEIPVYLCKDLADSLYLFQFPCRANEKTSPSTAAAAKNLLISSSRVKPEYGIIELDQSLSTDNEYYDKHVGEEFGCCSGTGAACITKQNAKDKDGKNKRSGSGGDASAAAGIGKLMDKITYQSQRGILKKNIKCYSVASFYNGKFCITPLHDSASFLPTYEHVERSRKAKPAAIGVGAGTNKNFPSNESSSDGETEESSPGVGVGGGTAVQVTVKFSQKNMEKSKSSQQMSHQQYLSRVSEEPWFEASYLNSNSSTALTLLEGLTNTVSRNRTSMFSLTEQQYLDVLVPADTFHNVK